MRSCKGMRSKANVKGSAGNEWGHGERATGGTGGAEADKGASLGEEKG